MKHEFFFQIWAVLLEVVWSLPQACRQLVLPCLDRDTSLWPQQPVGMGFTLCHLCCCESNGSFHCMEVSLIFIYYVRSLINGRQHDNHLDDLDYRIQWLGLSVYNFWVEVFPAQLPHSWCFTCTLAVQCEHCYFCKRLTHQKCGISEFQCL